MPGNALNFGCRKARQSSHCHWDGGAGVGKITHDVRQVCKRTDIATSKPLFNADKATVHVAVSEPCKIRKWLQFFVNTSTVETDQTAT
ncbi:hypothetical protein DPMN_001210 [Dreissena polymorpha]|uniref:Uncharacterized protein n=1 Tax=Dreissena polymorpha TaxID=45954 RepID=A0A9D4MLA3_DREPO|nr:hypothetical protein DPMN_001210 [Dreissena polymorpha]